MSLYQSKIELGGVQSGAQLIYISKTRAKVIIALVFTYEENRNIWRCFQTDRANSHRVTAGFGLVGVSRISENIEN